MTGVKSLAPIFDFYLPGNARSLILKQLNEDSRNLFPPIMPNLSENHLENNPWFSTYTFDYELPTLLTESPDPEEQLQEETGDMLTTKLPCLNNNDATENDSTKNEEKDGNKNLAHDYDEIERKIWQSTYHKDFTSFPDAKAGEPSFPKHSMIMGDVSKSKSFMQWKVPSRLTDRSSRNITPESERDAALLDSLHADKENGNPTGYRQQDKLRTDFVIPNRKHPTFPEISNKSPRLASGASLRTISSKSNNPKRAAQSSVCLNTKDDIKFIRNGTAVSLDSTKRKPQDRDNEKHIAMARPGAPKCSQSGLGFDYTPMTPNRQTYKPSSRQGTASVLQKTMHPHKMVQAEDLLYNTPDNEKRVIKDALKSSEEKHADTSLRKSLRPDAKESVARWLENASEKDKAVALQFFRTLSESKMAHQHGEQATRLQQVIQALTQHNSHGARTLPKGYNMNGDSGNRLHYLRLLTPNTRANRWMQTTWHHLPSFRRVGDTYNNKTSMYTLTNGPVHRHFTIHPDWGP